MEKKELSEKILLTLANDKYDDVKKNILNRKNLPKRVHDFVMKDPVITELVEVFELYSKELDEDESFNKLKDKTEQKYSKDFSFHPEDGIKIRISTSVTKDNLIKHELELIKSDETILIEILNFFPPYYINYQIGYVFTHHFTLSVHFNILKKVMEFIIWGNNLDDDYPIILEISEQMKDSLIIQEDLGIFCLNNIYNKNPEIFQRFFIDEYDIGDDPKNGILSKNENLAPNIIWTILNDEQIKNYSEDNKIAIYSLIAQREDLTEEMFEKLYELTDIDKFQEWGITATLASNPKTPIKIIQNISEESDNCHALEMISKRETLNDEIILSLAYSEGDFSDEIIEYVKQRQLEGNLNESLIFNLCKDYHDYRVQSFLAQIENFSFNCMVELIKNADDDEILKLIAFHNISEDNLLYLAQNSNIEIIKLISTRSDLSIELLKQMNIMKDELKTDEGPW